MTKFDILILENRCDIENFRNITEKFKLLPNDALIVATCKHYGIKKIATFDEDFRRVDFLELVDVENES